MEFREVETREYCYLQHRILGGGGCVCEEKGLLSYYTSHSTDSKSFLIKPTRYTERHSASSCK